MSHKLVGKVALVTGASSGIGAATALALAAEGAAVAIAARRLDRLETTAQVIRANGGKVLAIATDVTEKEQIRKLIATVQLEWGQIDILVNNAGVMLLSAVDGANTEEWKQMIDVNLLGLMYATHAVLPLMKAQGGGHIVNVSSVAGRFAFTNCAVYNATKFGVNGFSDALRQEVSRDKIRVTIVEPGVVATELTSHITATDIRERAQQRLQTNIVLQSDDIADAIVYAVTQKPHINVNEILVRAID
jgi:NADP-dependent 3-hydroxy acid dehydrogenase YdfG